MKSKNKTDDKDDESLTLSVVPLPAQILDKRRNSRAEICDKSPVRDGNQKECKEQKHNTKLGYNELILNLVPSTKTTTIKPKPTQLAITPSLQNVDVVDAVPKRKHWRSPSNPVDFAINCTYNSSPFNNIHFTDYNYSYSNNNNNQSQPVEMNMNTSELVEKKISTNVHTYTNYILIFSLISETKPKPFLFINLRIYLILVYFI